MSMWWVPKWTTNVACPPRYRTLWWTSRNGSREGEMCEMICPRNNGPVNCIDRVLSAQGEGIWFCWRCPRIQWMTYYRTHICNLIITMTRPLILSLKMMCNKPTISICGPLMKASWSFFSIVEMSWNRNRFGNWIPFYFATESGFKSHGYHL